jgi:hypothetical protein
MGASLNQVLLAKAVAPAIRSAFEREREFKEIVAAAKSGDLPDDLASEALALDERLKRRRVHVVDKNNKIVRDLTLAEVQIEIAKRHEIEFGVVDGAVQQTVCAGWGGKCTKKPPKSAFHPNKIKRRQGEPWRCVACAMRKRNASMTPEQRSEVARKGKSSMTPEQRSEAARKGKSSMTPEQRSEVARKANASMTPEQRSEAARRSKASMTPEQRSEAARRSKASMTPEQRSEASRKGRAARRAKAATDPTRA